MTEIIYDAFNFNFTPIHFQIAVKPKNEKEARAIHCLNIDARIKGGIEADFQQKLLRLKKQREAIELKKKTKKLSKK